MVSPLQLDGAVEARVDDLISQMNLSEKSKGKKCGYKPYTLKDYRQIKTNDYYEIKEGLLV